MIKSIAVALLLIVGFYPAAALAENHTFGDPISGFTVTKPESWSFARREVIPEIRGKIELKDEQLKALVMKNASTPIVVIMKYPEGRAGKVTPTFQVVRLPLPSQNVLSPEKVLSMTLATMPRAHHDFAVVSPVEKTIIDGIAGAKATYRMTLRTENEGNFAVRSRVWLVRVGRYELTIACQGPESGPDTSEVECAEIISSIRFGAPI